MGYKIQGRRLDPGGHVQYQKLGCAKMQGQGDGAGDVINVDKIARLRSVLVQFHRLAGESARQHRGRQPAAAVAVDVEVAQRDDAGAPLQGPPQRQPFLRECQRSRHRKR
jgi:hypothetical protein